MSGASIAQTRVLQQALTSATHVGGEMMLDAVTQSVEALKEGCVKAATGQPPADPAVVTAASFDTVLGLLADLKAATHAKV